MTPSAACAATSACLASAADRPTNVIDISLADGAPYALLRNACGVSLSALVERGDELRPNFVAPIGVKWQRRPRTMRPLSTRRVRAAPAQALPMQIDRCGRRCASPAYGDEDGSAGDRVVARAIVSAEVSGLWTPLMRVVGGCTTAIVPPPSWPPTSGSLGLSGLASFIWLVRLPPRRC
jgi:hypothetical protein